MNAALPAFQTPQPKHGADLHSTKVGRNRAEPARGLRDHRAEPAPGERFSDQLRQAAHQTTHAEQQASGATGRPQTDHHDSAPADGAVSEVPADQSQHAEPATTAPKADVENAGAAPRTAGASNTSASSIANATAPIVSTGAPPQPSAVAPDQQQTRSESMTALIEPVPAGSNSNQSAAEPALRPQQQSTGAAPLAAPVSEPTSGAPAEARDSNPTTGRQPDSAHASIPANPGDGATRAPATEPGTYRADVPQANGSPTHSPAQDNSGQAAQQQTKPSRSQDLQQRVQQAINDASAGEAKRTTAAQRRAAQINAGVQFEQAGSPRGAGLETSAAPSITPLTTAATTAVLDLAVTARTAEQPPVLLSNGQPVDEGAATGNVVRGLTALVNQRGGVMHMRLEPPELGQLRVQMTINQGTVTAQFQTATVQAQTVLERNITALRTALERHGLTVERLTVQVHQPAQSQNTSGQQLSDHAEQQAGRDGQHDAGGQASRGRGEHGTDDQQRRSFARFATEEFALGSVAEPQPIGAGANS